MKILQPPQFRLVGGDNHLAALLKFNLVFFAEFDHVIKASNAELGLMRPWSVIDSGVHNAAIVAGLVRG